MEIINKRDCENNTYESRRELINIPRMLYLIRITYGDVCDCYLRGICKWQEGTEYL